MNSAAFLLLGRGRLIVHPAQMCHPVGLNISTTILLKLMMASQDNNQMILMTGDPTVIPMRMKILTATPLPMRDPREATWYLQMAAFHTSKELVVPASMLARTSAKLDHNAHFATTRTRCQSAPERMLAVVPCIAFVRQTMEVLARLVTMSLNQIVRAKRRTAERPPRPALQP